MSNFWVTRSERKKIAFEVDQLALEILMEEGTLEDLFSVMNKEQTEFFMKTKITEFLSDPDDISFAIDLKA